MTYDGDDDAVVQLRRTLLSLQLHRESIGLMKYGIEEKTKASQG